jgi:hypothetical protein
MKKWEGVDLDGTLAYHDTEGGDWDGAIGAPIPLMLARVKAWIAEGTEVRIFTARVSPIAMDGLPADPARMALLRKKIGDWTELHCGKRLTTTCCKDHDVNRIWDDRARHVLRDVGEIGGKENVDKN